VSGSRGPVVVDTGVFGARLTPGGRLLASRYLPVLKGASYRLRGRGIDSLPSIKTQNQAD